MKMTQEAPEDCLMTRRAYACIARIVIRRQTRASFKTQKLRQISAKPCSFSVVLGIYTNVLSQVNFPRDSFAWGAFPNQRELTTMETKCQKACQRALVGKIDVMNPLARLTRRMLSLQACSNPIARAKKVMKMTHSKTSRALFNMTRRDICLHLSRRAFNTSRQTRASFKTHLVELSICLVKPMSYFQVALASRESTTETIERDQRYR